MPGPTSDRQHTPHLVAGTTIASARTKNPNGVRAGRPQPADNHRGVSDEPCKWPNTSSCCAGAVVRRMQSWRAARAADCRIGGLYQGQGDASRRGALRFACPRFAAGRPAADTRDKECRGLRRARGSGGYRDSAHVRIDPWVSVGVLVPCTDRHRFRVWMLMVLRRRYASARGCPGRDGVGACAAR